MTDQSDLVGAEGKASKPEKAGKSGSDKVPEDIGAQLEAALISTDRPLNQARLSEVVGDGRGVISVKVIKQAIADLNVSYKESGRVFCIEQVADGWQIMTLSEYAHVAAALNRTRAQTKLSPAAMETLAIVAYKQPALKADVETIRGVACGEVLRSLMERRMIKIVGRAEELGRPMLYGTTKSFLEVFGLKNLKDLPNVEELKPSK